MARFTIAFTTLFALAFMANVQAAPHHKMKTSQDPLDAILNPTTAAANPPSFNCTIARVETVTGLKLTTDAVNALDAGGNQTAADAISTAQQNLASAQDGVNTILQAIQAGQAPPSAAREQVGDGFNGAAVALLGINGTVTGADEALNDLISTGNFGNDVVANCN